MNQSVTTTATINTTAKRRVRTVVKSYEVAHLWAHQTQPSARTPNNKHFDGPDFYSYSTIIATIRFNHKGERAYLVSDSKYSVNTSSHQSDARSSIPNNATVFMVPGTSYSEGGGGVNYGDFGDYGRIMEAWTNEIKELTKESSESREPKKSRLILDADNVAQKMIRFAAFFQLKGKLAKIPDLPVNADVIVQMRQVIAAKVSARNAKEESDREAKRIAWIAAEPARQAAYETWLDGGRSFDGIWQFPTGLRVVGDEVETSRGASFPVSHAKRGLALVESVIARGESWARNGHTCHLGHYQIDKVDADGTVHAGCHAVPLSAIMRIREKITGYQGKEVEG